MPAAGADSRAQGPAPWITALALGLAGLGLGAGAPFHGTTLVVDGDTLMVGSNRVRLWGVDAVEGRQTCDDGEGRAYACGDRARAALEDLIGGQVVTCEPRDRDAYGRVVARCEARGRDLGGAMVQLGWAVDYAAFSHGAYASLEAEARRAHAGLWSGRFEQPSAWRARAREETVVLHPTRPSIETSPSGCRLKGNINARGEHIYHAPGQEHYEETRINPAAGERWFCTAAEAEAAGWRPARR